MSQRSGQAQANNQIIEHITADVKGYTLTSFRLDASTTETFSTARGHGRDAFDKLERFGM